MRWLRHGTGGDRGVGEGVVRASVRASVKAAVRALRGQRRGAALLLCIHRLIGKLARGGRATLVVQCVVLVHCAGCNATTRFLHLTSMRVAALHRGLGRYHAHYCAHYDVHCHAHNHEHYAQKIPSVRNDDQHTVITSTP